MPGLLRFRPGVPEVQLIPSNESYSRGKRAPEFAQGIRVTSNHHTKFGYDLQRWPVNFFIAGLGLVSPHYKP